MWSVTRFEGRRRPLRFWRNGRVITASLPQEATLTGEAGAEGSPTGRSFRRRFGFARTVTLRMVEGVHRGMLSMCRQMPAATRQVPFAVRSRSHAGSPSWQSMPVAPRFGVADSHSP